MPATEAPATHFVGGVGRFRYVTSSLSDGGTGRSTLPVNPQPSGHPVRPRRTPEVRQHSVEPLLGGDE